MGAGASVPDELTLEEAQALAGDQWDEKLTAFWPSGAKSVTREQFLNIVQNIPMFAKRPTPEEQLDWDNTPVCPAQPEQLEEFPKEATEAPKQQREKIEVAKRDKLDTEKLRLEKLAEENGMSVEEFMKLRAQSKRLPPRPKPTKVGKQQSQELRALMRQQRKAAMAQGRPPSRGLDEVECQLLLNEPKNKDGPGSGQSEPQIMVL